MIPLAIIFLRHTPAEIGLLPFGATEPPPPAKPRANPFKYALQTLREFAPRRDFQLVVFAFFVCGATTNGLIGTHLISACADHGYSEVQGAGLLAAIGVFDIIGTITSGWLTDRYDPRWLLFWYYGLRGISLLGLNAALNSAGVGLAAFVIFDGLDWVATVPPTIALCRKMAGAGARRRRLRVGLLLAPAGRRVRGLGRGLHAHLARQLRARLPDRGRHGRRGGGDEPRRRPAHRPPALRLTLAAHHPPEIGTRRAQAYARSTETKGAGMPVCGSCAGEVEASFRFCPWCAAPVRRKLVEFFPGRPFPGEIGKALRVSRYFPDGDEEGHVRFSVWNETGVAEAVVSLAEADARAARRLRARQRAAAREPSDAPGDVPNAEVSDVRPFRPGREPTRSGLPRARRGLIVAQ